jgi:hypothetical protein
MKNTEPCFAIVRVDGDRKTIKVIVWSLEKAESEVERLNELNEDKGCWYFWEPTRAERR